MPKNKNIELSKMVKLFPDEEMKVKQKVSLNSKEQMLLVTHAGNEIHLTIENWQSLNDLVNQATHIQKNIKV